MLPAACLATSRTAGARACASNSSLPPRLLARRPVHAAGPLRQAALHIAEEDSYVCYTTTTPVSSSRPSLVRHASTTPAPSSSSSSPSLASSSSPPAAVSAPTPPSATRNTGAPSATTLTALSLLRAQPSFYAIIELKARPYHIQTNDIVIAPRINDLALGDVIALDRVREIGSKDFILKGNPYVDPRYFAIKATVVEHVVSRETEVLFKKRSGRNRIIKNKSHHTALRVGEIEIVDKF
ncbi:hypothetical protein HDU87_001151 [Geranomyces variabilis]|uniref:Large ribosomal subunit protein bL21m n=1 Tax=Geranomyces variabilis TaxID=109894 RepID=A0AAD5TDW4_9FUNG|nr:hypothetical protein HDU87_001151 [Geranomyces variabilis]